MDTIIQKEIDDLLANITSSGINIKDPVSKLLVTTLIHQTQKIKDELNKLPERIIERLCSYFVPKNKIDAIPALCLVQPTLKSKKGIESHPIIDGSYYSLKIDNKQSINFYPLYKNLIIPYSQTYMLTPKFFVSKGTKSTIQFGKKGMVWLGLEVPVDIETVNNLSFFIKNSDKLLPHRICIGNDQCELAFVTSDRMEDIPMPEPFDSQQSNPKSLEIIREWKRNLSNVQDGTLIYINDPIKDRDIFRLQAYPKSFQQVLESTDLDSFEKNNLWFLFDFGNDYEIPDNIEIIPNVVPVVNVNVNNVTVTQSSPIAKLTKEDGSYFLNIIETNLSSQKHGFNRINEEITIRDFDSSCYNPEFLYRDVRTLYNRFIDDYHAFVEYHSLKDGELVRSLRDLVNKVSKSVSSQTDVKNRFDEGTYAMRSINLISSTSPIKLSYLTTNGKIGNLAKVGTILENKKDIAIEKDIPVISSAIGGEDKASVDQMYELLRYYTLTSDRLYTKMDIDAFLRIQLLKEFGKDEIKRITYNISIQGAAGEKKLVRGLYIDIFFKDKKNYQKALSIALDRKIHQLIIGKSCISMPIIVNVVLKEQ